jgi:hypothetical protein
MTGICPAEDPARHGRSLKTVDRPQLLPDTRAPRGTSDMIGSFIRIREGYLREE